MFEIKDNLYVLDAGTHYFCVSSTNRSYSATNTYTLYIHNIAPVSKDLSANLYAVCDKANIVFQFNKSKTKYYVNGNMIDFSYSYNRRTSSINYDIYLNKTPRFNVCTYQTEGTELPLEWQQVIPEAVHVVDASFSGIKDKDVLALSVCDRSTPCYFIHVNGKGKSSDKTYWNGEEPYGGDE